ncbi:MAG TPA: HEAT repeat domain-containing protein [Terracidiphilus sp.]|nr:HEAT repeat domain-containing protein [Terracidiphilus sp.]
MPGSNIDDLFAQALQGGYDSDEGWQAVSTLQGIGTREIFEKAAGFCDSNEPLKRARGAAILGQLGKTSQNPVPLFSNESFKVLTGMLESETNPIPLSAVIAALGHLGNASTIPMILPFSYHPDPDVRLDLAFALGCFANDKRTVTTLLKLMTDQDSDVRDWSTFGLGVLGDFDSRDIRDALFRNLKDSDEDVREEAMVGLAKRKDLRSLPEVMNALQSENLSPRAIDAANLLLERDTDRCEKPSACLEELRGRFREKAE